MAPTWDDVIDELTVRLPLLRDRDAVALDVGPYFVQVKRFGSEIAVIASGTGADLPESARLSPDRGRQMVALGWRPPDADPTHSLPDVTRPLPADRARRVAELLVATVRDVYGAATPAAVTFSSHNDNGQRAPTLTTVAMSPDQAPEPRVVAATLLPPPDPAWRGVVEAVHSGVGGWSRAEVEAVFAACGCTFAEDDWGTARATTGGLRLAALGSDEPGADFSAVMVTEDAPAASSGARFRAVLAAAVAVLGDPPLVGGGRHAFARWRGRPLTTIVSHRARRDAATVEVMVTPTEVIETEEYHDATYTDDWEPDHRWTTMPDTDAPEHDTLRGMATYHGPGAETIAELGSDLRALFASFVTDLPLLYPFASDARFRVRGPREVWLADGGFTRDGAWVSVDHGPREALDGAAVAGRVVDAIAASGVTSPGQLHVMVWSATPAERLEAVGFTVPRW